MKYIFFLSFIQAFSLFNGGVEFSPIHPLMSNIIGLGARIIWWVIRMDKFLDQIMFYIGLNSSLQNWLIRRGVSLFIPLFQAFSLLNVGLGFSYYLGRISSLTTNLNFILSITFPSEFMTQIWSANTTIKKTSSRYKKSNKIHANLISLGPHFSVLQLSQISTLQFLNIGSSCIMKF